MKNPRQKERMGPFKKLWLQKQCALFVNWLIDNHWEEIAPLLEQWKEEVDLHDC